MLNGNCRVTSSSYMFSHSSLVGIHIFHFCYYNLWNLIFCSHMIYHILIHISMVHNLEIEVNKHSCLKKKRLTGHDGHLRALAIRHVREFHVCILDFVLKFKSLYETPLIVISPFYG